jgi:hypothetical protein
MSKAQAVELVVIIGVALFAYYVLTPMLTRGMNWVLE